MNRVEHMNADVIVLGGGASGIAAAYTAAKGGAKVILVEKNEFLGGMATAAYVGTVCGLYYRSSLVDTAQFVCQGFAKDFALKLAVRSKTTPKTGFQGLHFLPYRRLDFIQLAEEILVENNVTILLQSVLCDVKRATDTKVASIKVLCDKHKISIEASQFIDASGYASFATYCPEINLIEANNYQAGAQVFGISGLHVEDERQLNLHLIKAQKEGYDSGLLKNDKSWVSLVPGSLRGGQGYLKLSIPFALHGSVDAHAKARLYARNRLMEYVSYFQKEYSPFKSIKLMMVAPDVGVRTGPRYSGDYTLTEQDVLTCRKHDNSAARGTWPIEYWKPGEKVDMTYFHEMDFYDIPVDCLRTNKLANLWFVGRHISANEMAIASARVIGTCFQMGETAGRLCIQ